MFLGIPFWGWLFLYGSVVGYGILLRKIRAAILVVVALVALIYVLGLVDNYLYPRTEAQNQAELAQIRAGIDQDRHGADDALAARDRFVKEWNEEYPSH